MVSGTVWDAFRQTRERFGDREFLSILPETAQHYGIDSRAYTYAQTAAEVARLADHYRAAGLSTSQRVGLMLENRPAMFLHWLALNSLGVSAVPLNTDWRQSELEYVIGHSEMVAAIVPESRTDEVRRAAARHSGQTVVGTEGRLEPVRSASETVSAPDVSTECALLYTSGTTGRPKGCVLTNEYYLWAGTWYAGLGGLCALREGSERLLTPLPMTHMNAMACSTMVMLLTGGCVIPVDRFHPRSWWDSVRESRATILHYLGVMPAMLLGSPPTATDRQHLVKFAFGAGVSSRLHAPFEARFGFPLIEAGAMTETGAGAAVIASREPRKVGTACFGRPSTRVDCRVITAEGHAAAPGEHGELCVRAHGERPRFGFFREYLKDPEATAAAWQEGYFRTGDIVYADEDGDFHFVDRKKNVIRRSGENISAVEVEGVLLQHPGVASVGVAAVPDAIRGDEVMACVVLRQSHADLHGLARELVEFCLQRLAYFKAPGFITFCETLPLTATQKLQRARLAELARELVGQDQTVDLRSLKKRAS